jgi:hypothetical protein
VEYIWKGKKGPSTRSQPSFPSHSHLPCSNISIPSCARFLGFKFRDGLTLRAESILHASGLHNKPVWCATFTSRLEASSYSPAAYLSPSWTVEVRPTVPASNGVLMMPFRPAVRNLPATQPHADLPSRCTRFIRYEGCTVAIAVEVVGLMMLLR